MRWWYWFLLGLGLLAFELATPGGLIALFFGISALIVGMLAGAGLAGPSWLQWVLFSVLAVAALALLRKPLQARLNVDGKTRRVDALEGESGVVLDDVSPGGVGKVELRGAAWSARTAGPATLSRGQRCRVDRVEGLVLWVRLE
jgi:membrane protein implicated in regulation of membrane protease activity